MVCEKENIDESESNIPKNKLIVGIKKLINNYINRPLSNFKSSIVDFFKYIWFIIKALGYNVIDINSFLSTSLIILAFLIMGIGAFAIVYDIEELKMINDLPLFMYSYVPISILAFQLLFEQLRDIMFYCSIYKSLKYSKKILDSKNGVNTGTLENFDSSFNNVRRKLKIHIGRVNTPLVTHDHMVESTFKNIDVFFDVVIKMISKKRGYLLEDPTGSADVEEPRICNTTIYVEHFLNQNKIGNIDYKLVTVFLDSFKDKFLYSAKPMSTKIISVNEFFEEWNEVLSAFEPYMVEKHEEKINHFYDMKSKRYESIIATIGRILESMFGFLLAFILSIIAGVIVYYTFL